MEKSRSKVISKRLKIHSLIIYESEFQILYLSPVVESVVFRYSIVLFFNDGKLSSITFMISHRVSCGSIVFSIICIGERVLKAISRKRIHAILRHTKHVVVSRNANEGLSSCATTHKKNQQLTPSQSSKKEF